MKLMPFDRCRADTVGNGNTDENVRGGLWR